MAPRKFKRALGQKNSMFQGAEQHDSQEFISTLLDALHEDCNRVLKKPYTESKDYDDTNNLVNSTEAWNAFLRRNKSIIVDLMFGQFKSKIQCPDCNRVSVTYDPYSVISLPIP